MKTKIIQIFWIIILIIGFGRIVFAEEIDDLRNKRNQIQEQIVESNEQVQEIQLQITEKLEELNKLNEKIAIYEADIKTLQKDLKKVEDEIKIIEDKLVIVENNYNLQRDALQNRIIALYESGDVLYLDVLLNSSSFSDFISNYFLIGEIARYDDQLLKDIDNQKVQIENIKSILKEKKENVNTSKENKEKTAIALENAKTIRNSYLVQLTEEEKETQNKINKYQEELNRIDAQIVAITTGVENVEYVGGNFAWPVPGFYTITSRFGPRIHPILKVPRSHSGTDIACPIGTNVLAANDGIVINSTFSTSGYGNMVMIDHGGGLVSLYGHGSELIAKVGDKVKKGDLIMKSGSTGWSTGPHLHFEIRLNGVAVDSLPYITGKTNLDEKNNNTNTNIIENKTNNNTTNDNTISNNNIVIN